MFEFECSREDCKNWKVFIQISRYGRGQRVIKNPHSRKMIVGRWHKPANFTKAGIYCGKCEKWLNRPPTRANVGEDWYYLIESIPPVDSIDAKDVVAKIRAKLGRRQQIMDMAKSRLLQEPRFGQLSVHLHNELKRALQRQSLSLKRLYTHQVAAIETVSQRKNVVLQTGTASGKSLAYQLPILDELIRDPDATALYLSPTKALARDQMRMLSEFEEDQEEAYDYGTYWRIAIGDAEIPYGVYEAGMTPEERNRVRSDIRILLTTPDMLNIGILPNHDHTFKASGKKDWESLFRGLRYVIVDEIHCYSGVFGSHVANVLRRLRRLCKSYGSDPIFFCCSATIANPKELAEELVGEPVILIDDDGAEKHLQVFLVWNPPIDAEYGLKRSAPGTQALDFLEHLLRGEESGVSLRRPIKTIVFSRSRKESNLICHYMKDRSPDRPEIAQMVTDYTAAFTAEAKRKIAMKIKEGIYNAVVATSALELGIDIGDLSVCVILGYPRSIASLWQQAGRVGRKGESVAIFVARNEPMDQYYADHPTEFLSKTPEEVIINPNNPHILKAHLTAAARELPLDEDIDKRFFGEELPQILGELKEEHLHQIQQEADGKWYWIDWSTYPAEHINIRNPLGKYNVEIYCGPKKLGQIDNSSALRDLHPGAIWFGPGGETHYVKRLDLKEHVALVERSKSDYYTRPLTQHEVHVINQDEAKLKKSGKFILNFGELAVRSRIDQYIRVKFAKREDKRKPFEERTSKPIQLVPMEEVMETKGLWFVVPNIICEMVRTQIKTPQETPETILLGGLHGMEHLICSMVPHFAICGQHDIGGTSCLEHSDLNGNPGIFIYESIPGGIGLAEKGFEKFSELVRMSLDRIENCPCTKPNGCPGCIQDPFCGSMNKPLNKEVAKIILQSLVKHLESYKPTITISRRVKRATQKTKLQKAEILEKEIKEQEKIELLKPVSLEPYKHLIIELKRIVSGTESRKRKAYHISKLNLILDHMNREEELLDDDTDYLINLAKRYRILGKYSKDL